MTATLAGVTAWRGLERCIVDRRREGGGPSRRVAGALSLAVLVTGACGSDSPAATPSKTVVIASTPFPENLIVADLYAGALRAAGLQVVVRKNMGAREILVPALREGGKANGIDLVPEYVGSLLEFVNDGAGEATGDLDTNMAKLRPRLEAMALTALNPSLGADQFAFAVTKATADKYKLKKVSDLAPVAGQLTLGAGSECPNARSCVLGLAQVYNVTFKAFRVLGSCQVSTLDALTSGDIDVGRVCSSDGGIATRNLVVLDDDKKLETADNIAPVVRDDIVDDTIRKALNQVSAALTNDELIQLNKRANIDKVDPEIVARDWLQQHGLTKK